MEWYEHFYTKNFIELVGFATPDESQAEASFIKNALRLPPGSKVLDLCCGYGRHTYLLSNLCNWHIVGLDLSDDYLNIARAQYSAPNIEYIKGDMRDIPFKDYFDGVLNMFSSFGVFASDDENEDVVTQVCKSLKSGGRFLLDYENKIYFIVNEVLQKPKYRKNGRNGQYFIFENEYDIINEREICKVSVLEDEREIASTGYSIRLYNFPEIKRMLLRNGFRIRRIWGDYNGGEYSVKSRRLIILSEKTQK